MRLSRNDLEALARTRPADVDTGGSGPSLWLIHGLAWWVHLSILGVLVGWFWQGRAGVVGVLVGSVVAGVLLLVSGLIRDLLHDLIISLSPRERVATGVLVICVGASPAFFERAMLLPDGLFWMTLALAPFTVHPRAARLLLALSLFAGWLAALGISGSQGQAAILVFGVSWLVAAGAVHYAWTGEAHGLGGWWPVRALSLGVIVTTLPALLTGSALGWFWPTGWSLAQSAASRTEVRQPPRLLLEHMQTFDLMDLLWRGLITLGLVLLGFVLLLVLRRMLLRRKQAEALSDLLPGQVAQLEVRRQDVRPKRPTLDGLRARVVALWGQWAAGTGRALELERRPGETAEAYARRIATEQPGLAPPEAMARLFDKAHYAHEEPSEEDLEQMTELVREQARRRAEQLRARHADRSGG